MRAKQTVHSKDSINVVLLLQCLIPGLEIECFLLKMYKTTQTVTWRENTPYTGTMISDTTVVGGVGKQECSSFDLPEILPANVLLVVESSYKILVLWPKSKNKSIYVYDIDYLHVCSTI